VHNLGTHTSAMGSCLGMDPRPSPESFRARLAENEWFGYAWVLLWLERYHQRSPAPCSTNIASLSLTLLSVLGFDTFGERTRYILSTCPAYNYCWRRYSSPNQPGERPSVNCNYQAFSLKQKDRIHPPPNQNKKYI